MRSFKTVFEVDSSLKWMPQQPQLKPGTCITKEKETRQGLHHTHQPLGRDEITL